MQKLVLALAASILLASCGGVPRDNSVMAISYTPSSMSSSSVADSSISSSSSLSSSLSSGTSSGALSSSAQASSSSFVLQNTQACVYDSTAKTLTCTEKVYQTVSLGTQTWMAENLNFVPTTGNSWCYGGADSNCAKYGRLYDWPTAMTVCPTGWYLPDTTTWDSLIDISGGLLAGTQLKAASSLWDSSAFNVGFNSSGFTALPGGSYYASSYYSLGQYGNWWTAASDGFSSAYARYMQNDSANVGQDYFQQSNGFSVRCVKSNAQ